MRIGVVRTAASPCRCAESVSKGLEALGHKYILVDSEEIESHALMLAETCDLVIDHTDTYCGRGLYRPFVRLLLESCGARVLGSSAEACFIADNKAAAKERLAAAGLPTPPGIVIHSKMWSLPGWLKPSLVLKPAFEHMSRGVCLVNTEQEAHSVADRLLESLRQPILLESFIPGRELAVSILDGPKGLQVLPVLEWGIDAGGSGILTEDFKLMNAADEKHRILRANLDSDLKQDLEAMAHQAFRALDLRDYARFDLRLSPAGNIYFLEANTTPSLEPLEALAASAAWAGLDYTALVERLLAAAQKRYETLCPIKNRLIRIELSKDVIELDVPEGVHFPPQSTIELARLLDVQPGEEALELGCGSGLLSIAMAKLGARRVVAIDLDPKALQATQQNARRNGVEDRIEVLAGSWYEALSRYASTPKNPGRFDVIVATPPQTPGLQPSGPKYGGPDGAMHLLKVLRGAAQFLKPDQGRLWMMAISLANPRAVWEHLQECFSDVAIVQDTARPFTGEEYETIEKGLFEYLRSLRLEGKSEFVETEKGQGVFRNLFIRAAKPRCL